eukprot:5455596-Pyramimonas_sp.AAC.1
MDMDLDEADSDKWKRNWQIRLRQMAVKPVKELEYDAQYICYECSFTTADIGAWKRHRKKHMPIDSAQRYATSSI